MELVVLGQREFAGIVDEVPGFARKMLAEHGQAAARSRRQDHRLTPRLDAPTRS